MHDFFLISVSGFVQYIPSSGITGSKGSFIFIFLKKFHTVFHNDCICIPPTVYFGSLFCTSSPVLVDLLMIDFLTGFKMAIYYCDFNLHLSDEQWHWASFHMSMGPLYVLLREMSVHVPCPFFNWIVCLPSVESHQFFIYLGDQTLSDVSLANIFYHMVSSHFILMMIPLDMQHH